MKHNLTRPCAHCPFRTDIEGYLTRERCHEIASSVLRGESFPCHETTIADESDDGEERIVTKDSEECAGAGIFAAHNGSSSQLSRIAERLRMKVAKLDMRQPVVKTAREMVEVHCGEQEEGETCAIVGPNCSAPAGYAVGNGIVEGDVFVTTTCYVCGEHVCEECSRMVKLPRKRKPQRVCDDCRDSSGD